MQNKGFTLVEIMVVIVIVGILAAVAVPRLTIAVDRARAAEGQRMLALVVPKLHAFRAERDFFVAADLTQNPQLLPASSGWQALGFNSNPNSRYFNFEITVSGDVGPAVDIGSGSLRLGSEFSARAITIVNLGQAGAGSSISIDHLDRRFVSSEQMRNLLPQWRGELGD